MSSYHSSLSAAQRLLRPASKYEVGGSARHALLGGGASESQRSSQDEGTRSVRSSGGRSLLLPSASPFAGAEHSALSKRVADHQAQLTEHVSTIKRLESKLDKALESQGQLHAQMEREIADVRGALPEMMRTLVSDLRTQMQENALAQAEDTRTMIHSEFAGLAASLQPLRAAHAPRARPSGGHAAPAPPLSASSSIVATPQDEPVSYAPTRRCSPPSGPRPPARHRSALEDVSPEMPPSAASRHNEHEHAGRKRMLLDDVPRDAAAKRTWGTLEDLRQHRYDEDRFDDDRHGDGRYGDSRFGDEDERGGASWLSQPHADKGATHEAVGVPDGAGSGDDVSDFDLFGDEDQMALPAASAPPPTRVPSAAPTPARRGEARTPSPTGSALSPSAASSHYTPLSAEPPSRQTVPGAAAPPSRAAAATPCAGRLEARFDGEQIGGGVISAGAVKRARGPVDEEKRHYRIGEPPRYHVLQGMMGGIGR